MPNSKDVPGARNQGILFVLSGPSGSGKTTLAQAMLKDQRLKQKLARSISFTTRPRRRGERSGSDYFFISKNEFLRARKAEKILEWTRYLGYYYGTAKAFVDEQLRQARSLILCLDVRGARRVKQLYPGSCVTVFIMPPSVEELLRRIQRRARETKSTEIQRRLSVARREMRAAPEFDHCLVNRDLRTAVRALQTIIRSSLQPQERKDVLYRVGKISG